MAEPWASLSQATAGVPVDGSFESRARRYLEELDRWSRVSRLTGYATEAERVAHLVLGSVVMLQVLPEPVSPLLDIGSGNGAPGLVLKLARPEWAVTLVEAKRLRANFLRHVIRELALEGITVHEARAEVLASAEPALRGRFQTVTMRAVGPPPVASALAGPYLAPTGHLVLPVGPGAILSFGRRREVTGLSKPRAFLIIGASELARDVPRETRGVSGPGPRGREPKGRRR